MKEKGFKYEIGGDLRLSLALGDIWFQSTKEMPLNPKKRQKCLHIYI